MSIAANVLAGVEAIIALPFALFGVFVLAVFVGAPWLALMAMGFKLMGWNAPARLAVRIFPGLDFLED